MKKILIKSLKRSQRKLSLINEISINEMSINEMSINEISINEMSINKKYNII